MKNSPLVRLPQMSGLGGGNMHSYGKFLATLAILVVVIPHAWAAQSPGYTVDVRAVDDDPDLELKLVGSQGARRLDSDSVFPGNGMRDLVEIGGQHASEKLAVLGVIIQSAADSTDLTPLSEG